MHKIGIQLEEPFVKWAKISLEKKTFTIESLHTEPLSLNATVKPLYFSESDSLISGLETTEILFRNIELPTHEKSKIYKLLPFQVESQLPYPLEEAVLGLQLVVDSQQKKGKASIFSIKSPNLEAHIEKYKQHSIEITQVSCYPAALSRFFHFLFPSVSQAVLLHIGEKTSTALYLEGKSILFSHSFPIGLERSTSQEGLLQVGKELDRMFAFLEKKIPESCSTIVLTGDFVSFPLFPDFVAKHLPPTLQMLPLPSYGSYSPLTLSTYAIAIGLALEGLILDGKSLSFCEGPFSTPFMKRRKKKKALAFMTAALALSCVVFLMGNLYLETRKRALLKGFSLLLPKEKNPIDTLDALEQEIYALELKEKKEQKNYSIALPLPNVSDTLAFLSTYPILQKDVEILTVNYSLAKYPKVAVPKDPYLGKVSLELMISNPKVAATFYDKFCQNNPVMHDKKEVTWEEKGTNLYLLTFFLKPLKEISP